MRASHLPVIESFDYMCISFAVLSTININGKQFVAVVPTLAMRTCHWVQLAAYHSVRYRTKETRHTEVTQLGTREQLLHARHDRRWWCIALTKMNCDRHHPLPETHHLPDPSLGLAQGCSSRPWVRCFAFYIVRRLLYTRTALMTTSTRQSHLALSVSSRWFSFALNAASLAANSLSASTASCLSSLAAASCYSIGDQHTSIHQC